MMDGAEEPLFGIGCVDMENHRSVRYDPTKLSYSELREP